MLDGQRGDVGVGDEVPPYARGSQHALAAAHAHRLEADVIIRRRYSSEWIAAEVKLSHSPGVIDAAAATLLHVADSVDTSKAGPRAALLVITPAGYAHTRPDGVTVAPIGALCP